MTKVRIQNKRAAILEAATKIFAERGFWNTPTLLISREAGVAEGTLFTYFKTKNVLINTLYLEIKMELVDVLMAEYENNKTNKDKIRHVWNRYIQWCIKNPQKHKVVEQLKVSDKISIEVRNQASQPFAKVIDTVNQSIEKNELRNIPVDYIGVMMNSFIDGTITHMTSLEEQDTDYINLGFEIFWRGISA